MDSFDNDRFIRKSNFLLCYALYNNRPGTRYLNALDLTISEIIRNMRLRSPDFLQKKSVRWTIVFCIFWND